MSQSFRIAVQQLLSSTNISLYGLVDGLQYERFTGKELIKEKNEVVPLFDRYPDSRIAFAGPWLVDMQRRMDFSEQLVALEIFCPSVSWITTSVNLDQLVKHLQQFMNIILPEGETALLRFQDPRVQPRLGTILDEEQHSELTGITTGWVSLVNNQVYSLREKEFI
ncbi:DUF4123 domain-containing protein [Cronobacter sakazakii]|uniref:DUF4123 domain-containing protein n=1 Tax=Cronobacter sakazakii TaxID=28141 RepID=UPI000CFCE049|nr:DUF4123 domain-containing protein [Cronobacter sakazakii]EMA4769568.1 DUF4123 domain-containing protein [Cronobacter sakazakii]MDK1165229.1 DUF4123 domain-containing protein [Cronobacter sakazakii]